MDQRHTEFRRQVVFDTIAIIFRIDPEEICGDKLLSSLSL